jgi:antitoxin HigA-1
MNRLALDLRVPVTRISGIVHERRGITTVTALRLARYFNTTARYSLNLQAAYDLEVAQDRFSDQIDQEVRLSIPPNFSTQNKSASDSRRKFSSKSFSPFFLRDSQ